MPYNVGKKQKFNKGEMARFVKFVRDQGRVNLQMTKDHFGRQYSSVMLKDAARQLVAQGKLICDPRDRNYLIVPTEVADGETS